MPAAHIRSKYCLVSFGLSGVNRLGNVLIRGPEVSMKHSTPWRDELEASEGSVISRKSESRRVNGVACTTLTPETELDADSKRVDVPEECSNWRFARSSVIPNVCKKSRPRIGRGTFVRIKTNEYERSPSFICFLDCPNARMGVPLAAARRRHDGMAGDDGEAGKRETWEPVSRRQCFREILSDTRPSWAGRGPAVRGDRPRSFPDPCQCERLRVECLLDVGDAGGSVAGAGFIPPRTTRSTFSCGLTEFPMEVAESKVFDRCSPRCRPPRLPHPPRLPPWGGGFAEIAETVAGVPVESEEEAAVQALSAAAITVSKSAERLLVIAVTIVGLSERRNTRFRRLSVVALARRRWSSRPNAAGRSSPALVVARNASSFASRGAQTSCKVSCGCPCTGQTRGGSPKMPTACVASRNQV